MAEPDPSDRLTASEIADLYQVDPKWVAELMQRGYIERTLRHGSWTERKAPRWAVEDFMRQAHVPLWARRGWPEAGFVCFIQAESGGPIKICAGLDPKSRLRDTQRGQSDRLVLVAMLPGQGQKRELADRFMRWRLPGTRDWFAADAPGLAELIASAQQTD
jgi:hypothetical protein